MSRPDFIQYMTMLLVELHNRVARPADIVEEMLSYKAAILRLLEMQIAGDAANPRDAGKE